MFTDHVDEMLAEIERLKSLAEELLTKYKKAESENINGCSFADSGDFLALDVEVMRYRRLINEGGDANNDD